MLRSGYLQVILLEDGSLHEVHVADGDGGKVDGVEGRRERVHVGGDGVREEVEDGPEGLRGKIPFILGRKEKGASGGLRERTKRESIDPIESYFYLSSHPIERR